MLCCWYRRSQVGVGERRQQGAPSLFVASATGLSDRCPCRPRPLPLYRSAALLTAHTAWNLRHGLTRWHQRVGPSPPYADIIRLGTKPQPVAPPNTARGQLVNIDHAALCHQHERRNPHRSRCKQLFTSTGVVGFPSPSPPALPSPPLASSISNCFWSASICA